MSLPSAFNRLAVTVTDRFQRAFSVLAARHLSAFLQKQELAERRTVGVVNTAAAAVSCFSVTGDVERYKLNVYFVGGRLKVQLVECLGCGYLRHENT